MKADRGLASRAQGDRSPKTGGDCFDHFQRLKFFEPDAIEARVQAALAKHKQVYDMKKQKH